MKGMSFRDIDDLQKDAIKRAADRIESKLDDKYGNPVNPAGIDPVPLSFWITDDVCSKSALSRQTTDP